MFAMKKYGRRHHFAVSIRLRKQPHQQPILTILAFVLVNRKEPIFHQLALVKTTNQIRIPILIIQMFRYVQLNHLSRMETLVKTYQHSRRAYSVFYLVIVKFTNGRAGFMTVQLHGTGCEQRQQERRYYYYFSGNILLSGVLWVRSSCAIKCS